MASETVEEPLLIVSSDGHVGAPVEAYRDYVDPGQRAEFEDWLAAYQPLWMATQLKDADLPETLSEDYKREWIANAKIAAGAEGTWNPAKRLELLDADGLAADVLFPDDQSANSPPFLWFAREYHRRWDEEYSPALKLAGARAYNRWLADYCSAARGRLLGLAMIGSLADVPAAVAEVRRAHASGLTAGVLLPLTYYNIVEPFWNDPGLDPLWATCAELGMAVHTHTGSGGPYYGTGVDAPILYSVECTWFPHRPLWFMTMSGVFERHPGLRLILTEQGSGWVLEWLTIMDAMARDAKFAFSANSGLSLKPSEYFQRQCWLGSSLVHRREIEMRHAIGVDKMMWGWDFPHIESADWLAPQDNIRSVMQGVPEREVKAMLAGNAAAAYGLDLAPLREIAKRVGPRVGALVSA